MSARSFTAGLAAVVAFTFTPREAEAYCQMTTSEPTSGCATTGTPLAWKRRCIEWSLDSRGSSDVPISEVEGAVAASFATWLNVQCDGELPGFEVRESAAFAECSRSTFDSDGGNVNVIAFVPELDDGPILALTTVWYSTSTGEIFDADILVNEGQGPFALCPAVGCLEADSPHDLTNVLTHEVGHFFGLAHATSSDATMFASSRSGETLKRTLSADDEAGFCATYGAQPLPAQCDFEPRGGLDLSCEGGNRGCAMSPSSLASRSDPFPLAFLCGVTFVVTLVRRRARGSGSDTLRPRD
ncbi:MAG: matrixin family metalloprotease [Polyangiaceae bacterium]|nr:matrixin family metalloprotease [Polyangiaceae bacterium]